MLSISLIYLTPKEIRNIYHFRVQNFCHDSSHISKHRKTICIEAQSDFTKDISIIKKRWLKRHKVENKCLMCITIQPIVCKERP